MRDVVIGLLALGVGALFCFRGYLAMRIIIPIWGAFTGFVLGAAVVASFTDEGFLGTLLGWIVGALVAMVFGLIAYLYYEVTVIVAMLSIGFTLGTTVMVAFDVQWSWLVILVGVAVALLLAILAIVADLPTVILVVLTSFAGASAMVLGVMLLVGRADTEEFRTDALVASIDDAWWWWVIYVVLAVAGLIAQVRLVEGLRTSVRTAWTDAGGREPRS